MALTANQMWTIRLCDGRKITRAGKAAAWAACQRPCGPNCKISRHELDVEEKEKCSLMTELQTNR